MLNKNYAASHQTVTISTKRFDMSPFVTRYLTDKTVFGISANRFYPLSTDNDPTDAYWNLKKNVMLYDVPEKPLEISGKGAVEFLERIFTRTINDLKILHARYAIACNYEGGIIMDGVLIRLANDKFWYIHANGDFETWLLAHSTNLNVCIRDPKSWAIQIQGPNALKLLKSASPKMDLENFKYFNALFLDFNGQTFLTSRTGWTGELGFELYTNGPKDDNLGLWDYLMKKGSEYGILTGGLDSMGIRRIEAGILDYGTDMDRSNNPFEMGLGRLVDLKKSTYIGKEKLQSMNKNSMLYGIKCDETVPFSGLNVLDQDEVVGTTTVGAFSPLLKSGIGFALFKKKFDWLGKKLSLQDYNKISYDCEITALPFYDQSKKIPRGHK